MNLAPLTLAALTIAFSGCGKTPSPAPQAPPPDPLLGTWQISRETNMGGLMKTNISIIMTIGPEGKFRQTTSRSSSTLLGSASDPDQTFTGTWTRTGNQLSVRFEAGQEETMEILSVSEHELLLNISSQQQAFRRLTPPIPATEGPISSREQRPENARNHRNARDPSASSKRNAWRPTASSPKCA
jgi:hypothetical protein